MDAKYDHSAIARDILADELSYRSIADKHGCSVGVVQGVKRKLDAGKMNATAVVSDVPRIGNLRVISEQEYGEKWNVNYIEGGVLDDFEYLSGDGRKMLLEIIKSTEEKAADRIRAHAEFRASVQWRASLCRPPKGRDEEDAADDQDDDDLDEFMEALANAKGA